MATQLQIAVPDFVDVGAGELRMLLAATLYDQGRLSLGQGAEMAGLSKRAFMESLGSCGISAFNHSPDDLARDLANA
jgi:predicted HTH domain antitoxin